MATPTKQTVLTFTPSPKPTQPSPSTPQSGRSKSVLRKTGTAETSPTGARTQELGAGGEQLGGGTRHSDEGWTPILASDQRRGRPSHRDGGRGRHGKERSQPQRDPRLHDRGLETEAEARVKAIPGGSRMKGKGKGRNEGAFAHPEQRRQNATRLARTDTRMSDPERTILWEQDGGQPVVRRRSAEGFSSLGNAAGSSRGERHTDGRGAR